MTCDQATKLLSDAEERKLSRRERFGLRFHVLICKSCRRFRDHLRLLRRLLTDATPKMLASVYASDATLSESRRQQIKRLLLKARDEQK